MKIGRNDPCRCGSGKKYKRCCLNKGMASQEFGWAKINKSRSELVRIMLKFAVKKYGEDSVLEAWDEFNCWDENAPEFDPESYQNQIFMPWYLYNWAPDAEETTVLDEKLHDVSIGQALLDWKQNKLSSLQIEYVERCLESPFSFFEIIQCRKGEGYQLKDLITLEEYNVIEKMGSESTEKSDLLFGKLVTIEGITMLEACSPFSIPPSMKLPILELRKLIKTAHPTIEKSTLKKYDFEFLDLYHFFHDSILNPEAPKICNTDGDDMIPQKLIYQVESLDDVFEKIHHLDIVSTREELFKEAILESDGKLKELNLSWYKKGNKKHKSWDNTVLGHIELKESKMIISVNSNERTEKIKKLMHKLLGTKAIYKNSVIEDLTSVIEGKVGSSQQNLIEQEDLMNDPEVQEKIKEMMRSHWSNWVNEEVPALDGKTPKQASRSKDGRELLDGLLTDFERSTITRPQPGVDLETFRKIREDLGILKED